MRYKRKLSSCQIYYITFYSNKKHKEIKKVSLLLLTHFRLRRDLTINGKLKGIYTGSFFKNKTLAQLIAFSRDKHCLLSYLFLVLSLLGLVFLFTAALWHSYRRPYPLNLFYCLFYLNHVKSVSICGTQLPFFFFFVDWNGQC